MSYGPSPYFFGEARSIFCFQSGQDFRPIFREGSLVLAKESFDCSDARIIKLALTIQVREQFLQRSRLGARQRLLV